MVGFCIRFTEGFERKERITNAYSFSTRNLPSEFPKQHKENVVLKNLYNVYVTHGKIFCSLRRKQNTLSFFVHSQSHLFFSESQPFL